MSENYDEPDGAADPPRRKKQARKAFLLRLPPELMTELRGWADNDFRSLNAHIEYLLRQSLKRRKGQKDEE